MEYDEQYNLHLEGSPLALFRIEVEIISEDIPGWLVANEGTLTVALDVTITESLRQEGIARELINRIQNLRKDKGFEVTDKIEVFVEQHSDITEAIVSNNDYICSETLATRLDYSEAIANSEKVEVELTDDIKTFVLSQRLIN